MRIVSFCTFVVLLTSVASCKKADIVSVNKETKESIEKKALNTAGLPYGDLEFYGDEDFSQSGEVEEPTNMYCYAVIRYTNLGAVGYPYIHSVNFSFNRHAEEYGAGNVQFSAWYGGNPDEEWRYTTTSKYVTNCTAFINYELFEVAPTFSAKYTIASSTKWEGTGTYSNTLTFKRTL